MKILPVRTYKLWEYHVSHGNLLVRSPIAPGAHDEPAVTTNIDVICIGLKYIAAPTYMRGCKIENARDIEIEGLSELLNTKLTSAEITIFTSKGRRFPIVAEEFHISEHTDCFFSSPFKK